MGQRFFLDKYIDPNGTLLTAHSPEVGGPYSGSATFEIQSNAAITTAVAGGVTASFLPMPKLFNATLRFTITQSDMGWYFNQVDASHFYFLNIVWDGIAANGTIAMYYDNGSGVTLIASHSLPANAGVMDLHVRRGPDWSELTINANNVDYDFTLPVDIAGDGMSFNWNMNGGNSSPIFDYLSVSTFSGVSSMINLRTGQFNLHREGVAKLLAIAGQALCDGTALAVTAEVRLFTSANAPGCDDVAADYTEATFSGYAPVLIDSGGDGCTDILEVGVDASGIGQLIFDQQAWTEGSPATITETVTGCYVVLIIGGDDFLLASLLFDTPAQMAVAGDILKVNGFALLDCQMAEVP